MLVPTKDPHFKTPSPIPHHPYSLLCVPPSVPMLRDTAVLQAVNAQIQGVSLAIGAAFGSACSAYYNGAAVFATAVVIGFCALAWRVHAEFTVCVPKAKESQEKDVSRAAVALVILRLLTLFVADLGC